MEKLVLDFSKTAIQKPDLELIKKKYCLFYPMIGKDYNERKALMVYGQYVNEWQPTFKTTANKANIETVVKKAFDYSTVKKGCSLQWVNNQWIKQNLFRVLLWNITYKLAMEQYGRTEDDWNNIIAYSNLYKIAPSELMSPTAEELAAQTHDCANLFKEELSILQPKNVLIITNLKDWAAPILKNAGIKFTTRSAEYVQATAAYRGSQLIITDKPFAANHQRFINEVKQFMV